MSKINIYDNNQETISEITKDNFENKAHKCNEAREDDLQAEDCKEAEEDDSLLEKDGMIFN
jgi:hypothetical protein